MSLVTKTGSVYIIAAIYRPGVPEFMKELEHLFYEPDTEKNEKFNLFVIKYTGMPYVVIEVPDLRGVSELSAKHNLKLVNGKPYDGNMEFPVECKADACFTMENDKYNFINA